MLICVAIYFLFLKNIIYIFNSDKNLIRIFMIVISFENGKNIISFHLSGKLSYTWATH
jgi:hypothetical protein